MLVKPIAAIAAALMCLISDIAMADEATAFIRDYESWSPIDFSTGKNPPLPLTKDEISDAKLCMVGTMLSICAGDKKIATGIMINNQMAMTPLPDWFKKDAGAPILIMPTGQNESKADYLFIEESLFKQTIPNTPYSKAIYILDGEQLDQLINYARAHPDVLLEFGSGR